MRLFGLAKASRPRLSLPQRFAATLFLGGGGHRGTADASVDTQTRFPTSASFTFLFPCLGPHSRSLPHATPNPSINTRKARCAMVYCANGANTHNRQPLLPMETRERVRTRDVDVAPAQRLL